MWLMCGIEWLQLRVTAKNNSLNGMHRTESNEEDIVYSSENL